MISLSRRVLPGAQCKRARPTKGPRAARRGFLDGARGRFRETLINPDFAIPA
jgi:hypothetical protein